MKLCGKVVKAISKSRGKPVSGNGLNGLIKSCLGEITTMGPNQALPSYLNI